MAGAVQHGASTLPAELFGNFPGHDCAEIHLATEFQNMVFDHPVFPLPLKRAIERWLLERMAGEKKKGETESQFFYKTRKQAVGEFKEEMWNLPPGTREAIRDTLERRFAFLFEKLGVPGTREVVARHVRPVQVAGASALRSASRLRARRRGGRLTWPPGKKRRKSAPSGQQRSAPGSRLPAPGSRPG